MIARSPSCRSLDFERIHPGPRSLANRSGLVPKIASCCDRRFATEAAPARSCCPERRSRHACSPARSPGRPRDANRRSPSDVTSSGLRGGADASGQQAPRQSCQVTGRSRAGNRLFFLREPPTPGLTVALVAALLLAMTPVARAESLDADPAVTVLARALAAAIAARDARAAAALCTLPVNLDGRRVESRAALVQAWRSAFSSEALTRLALRGFEVMTLRQAEERFGPPPRRLGPLDEDAFVVIIRWDRAQLAVVVARRDDRWAIVAVTD